jgi:uncharacterized membrane protein
LIWAVILVVPLILDGMLQALGTYESKNNVRLITGFSFGVGLQFILAFFMVTIKLLFNSNWG